MIKEEFKKEENEKPLEKPGFSYLQADFLNLGKIIYFYLYLLLSRALSFIVMWILIQFALQVITCFWLAYGFCDDIVFKRSYPRK